MPSKELRHDFKRKRELFNKVATNWPFDKI